MMSDAFADLWNSSTPSKPVAPKTLGGSTSSSATNSTRKTQDVFSLLSSAGATTSSLNASYKSHSQQSRPAAAPQLNPSKPPKGDAFGDLLGGSMASTNDSRMTIAERAAQAERQRSEAQRKQQQAAKSEASAWAGLDSLSNKSFTPSTRSQTSKSFSDNEWDFSPVPRPSQPTRPAKAADIIHDEDDWGLNDFTSSSTTSSVTSKHQASNVSQSRTLWELDEFIAADASSSNSAPSAGHIQLGDQNDSLLTGNSNDEEEDILGDLGKPIDSISRGTPSGTRTRSAMVHHTNSNSPSGSRPVSPPPHIIGQIVEMGFSVQQARVALAATDTGMDVEAALETLLSNGAASSSLPPAPRHQPPTPAIDRGQRDRTNGRSRSSSLRPDTEEPEVNLQEQADKLIAQASEIGLNVLNKASLFWREGKERVQKAYEERAAGGSLAGGAKKASSNIPSRPKWMTDIADGENEVDQWKLTPSGFKDGIETPTKPSSSTSQKNAPGSQVGSGGPITEKTSSAEADLLSNEPAFYVSPWRRGKSRPKLDSIEPTAQVAPLRPSSPIKPVSRANVISASQSAISLSVNHKDRGAEKFKLGQYSEAESAYTSAIAALPDLHLLLIPLYNNRALARLKIGDYTGVIEDTTAVVDIIGSGYHPARELKVSREEEGARVDLADSLVKALKRRAEALEGREKWEEAKKDWETLAGLEWARQSSRSEAVSGAGRCKRMTQAATTLPVNGTKKAGPSALSRVKKPAVSTRPSEALARLRSANDAANAEDQARHELKDRVDTKIMAWKAGKETNIRALLASLDAVLWPELGLQKVGMAELVSVSQVKIRYTKTIAKLHPDKLNPNNSTTEQRMLANGVFSTLNDAWNSFKQ